MTEGPVLRAVDGSEPFDPWKVVEEDLGAGTYDRDKCYVRSTDGKGHDGKTWVRMPPELLAATGKMVALGVYPSYTSTQAIIRDALVHLLHHRNEQMKDSGLQRVVTNEMRLAEIEEVERNTQSSEEVVESAKKVLEKLARMQDMERLKDMVKITRGHAKSMPAPYSGMLYELVDQYEPRVIAWEREE